MTLNRAELKANAKIDIKQTKPNVILVTLVYVLIIYVLEILSAKLSGEMLQMKAMLEAVYNGDTSFILPQVEITPVASIIVFALGIMSTMLGVGYSLFCLNAVRHRAPAYGNLFDPFGMFFKILWLNILMNVFIMLWSMLFVIPGIIAAYRYRMAVYVLLEHPECSALECIRESKRLMQGHKGELFILDLSFIGWAILCTIPFVTLWVSPYMELTNVWFYVSLADGPSVDPGYGSYGADFSNNGGHGTDGKPPWES